MQITLNAFSFFWLGAKATKASVEETKAMVKEIVDKMGARDCSYPLDLVVIPCRNLHTVIVEEVLQKVIRWLSPPDPSTNYAIGLRDLHEATATWFLESAIFREWYSTGSLLWINGKRAFVNACCLILPDGPHHS